MYFRNTDSEPEGTAVNYNYKETQPQSETLENNNVAKPSMKD